MAPKVFSDAPPQKKKKKKKNFWIPGSQKNLGGISDLPFRAQCVNAWSVTSPVHWRTAACWAQARPTNISSDRRYSAESQGQHTEMGFLLARNPELSGRGSITATPHSPAARLATTERPSASKGLPPHNKPCHYSKPQTHQTQNPRPTLKPINNS